MAPITFVQKPKERSSVRSRLLPHGAGTATLAALSSCAPVAALWPGTAMAAAAKHPIAYFNLHPCALFTEAQAGTAIHSHVTRTTSEPNSKFGGACLYATSAKPNVDLSFAPGPLSSLSFVFQGKRTSESSVAPGPICIVVSASSLKKSGALDPSNLLLTVPGAFVVDVSTETCVQAVPLAKLAVSEIS